MVLVCPIQLGIFYDSILYQILENGYVIQVISLPVTTIYTMLMASYSMNVKNKCYRNLRVLHSAARKLSFFLLGGQNSVCYMMFPNHTFNVLGDYGVSDLLFRKYVHN